MDGYKKALAAMVIDEWHVCDKSSYSGLIGNIGKTRQAVDDIAHNGIADVTDPMNDYCWEFDGTDQPSRSVLYENVDITSKSGAVYRFSSSQSKLRVGDVIKAVLRYSHMDLDQVVADRLSKLIIAKKDRHW